MERAWISDNKSLFEKADSYRVDYWNSIIKQQHDLTYFGHFSLQDSNQMVPFERRRFLELTVERFDQEHKKEG